MNPIIDPMWFYWIKVADITREICMVVAVLMLVAVFVLVILMAVRIEDNYSGPEKMKLKKWAIAIGIVLAVSLAGSIFIPSKETLIEMMVAKYVTYDNAKLTVDGIKSVVDYIVEAIKSIK